MSSKPSRKNSEVYNPVEGNKKSSKQSLSGKLFCSFSGIRGVSLFFTIGAARDEFFNLLFIELFWDETLRFEDLRDDLIPQRGSFGRAWL